MSFQNYLKKWRIDPQKGPCYIPQDTSYKEMACKDLPILHPLFDPVEPVLPVLLVTPVTLVTPVAVLPLRIYSDEEYNEPYPAYQKRICKERSRKKCNSKKPHQRYRVKTPDAYEDPWDQLEQSEKEAEEEYRHYLEKKHKEAERYWAEREIEFENRYDQYIDGDRRYRDYY